MHRETESVLDSIHGIHRETESVLDYIHGIHREIEPVLDSIHGIHREIESVLDLIHSIQAKTRLIPSFALPDDWKTWQGWLTNRGGHSDLKRE